MPFLHPRHIDRSVCWIAALFLLIDACLAAPGLVAQEQKSGKIDFAHDIVPILKKRCAQCHTNGTYKGGLSMDHRDALLDSGSVEVGDAKASLLLERITTADVDQRMPPEGDPLTAAEVRKIADWIDSGLSWEPGFSFRKQTWKAPLEPRLVAIPEDAGNPIDYLVDQYFEERGIEWPQSVDDATFLRRVTLDLVGLLPTQQELRDFLQDPSPTKRSRVVQTLLERDRDYADHWLTFWNDHLRNDYAGTGYIDGGRQQITAWLYQALHDNLPYDQFARQLIAPTPASEGFIRGIRWRGNVNASQVQELQFAQNVSQVFLGENLKCASCHDSFINDWKLEDAYGLAAVLSDQPLEMYRCDKPTGQVTGPRFLWPELGAIDAQASRQQRLEQVAELVTGERNGRFPRTIVNRIWKRMMGRGLVEPVDIMGNRPWNEDLLDYLAVDLQKNQFNLKKTMALIANSRIYQAQTIATGESAPSEFVFRGPAIRRMTAEQFLDAVWQVTGTEPTGQRGPIPEVTSERNRESSAVSDQPLGQWLWDDTDALQAAGDARLEFIAELQLLPDNSRVGLVITCDNEFTLFVNERKVRQDDDWTSVEWIDLKSVLKPGSNRLRVVAQNHTSAPNPAGLYVSLLIDGQPVKLPWKIREANAAKAATAIARPEVWAAANPKIVALETRAIRGEVQPRTRAAHVVADSLMRSLGRPNREQVVTTRDDQLSTLQALDLSNGEIFTRILQAGAQRIGERFDSPEEIIQQVYEQALSRQPTTEEQRVLTELVGQTPSPEAIADLLWAVFMLPEFQHVR